MSICTIWTHSVIALLLAKGCFAKTSSVQMALAWKQSGILLQVSGVTGVTRLYVYVSQVCP